MALLKLISKLFPKQQSPLEQFIVSKRPLNAADVEHWTRRYYEGQARGL
jgi:hypothetical protein